jgi:hypothetical protein
LMEETGVPGQNHRPAASYWQTVSHNVLFRVHLSTSRARTYNVSGDS